MFRKLARAVRLNSEGYLDRSIAPDIYGARLSHYGNLLVRNLHGHHSWEDRSFFPELSAADPRFDAGLDTLESDHATLDQVLDRFKRHANRAVQLIQLDEKQAASEAGDVERSAIEIEALLTRPLVDEEDLVVPILLHHKMRG